jgi:hypothetical protein
MVRGGDDRIAGLGGNDLLRGGNGNDFLRGGAGDDVLNGNAGNDFLYGDGGNNLLRGGAGRDVFVLDNRAAPRSPILRMNRPARPARRFGLQQSVNFAGHRTKR